MVKSVSPLDQKENDVIQEKIFDFLDMSQRILALVKHENVILESCGCLSMEAYLEHRNVLLQHYELSAKEIIDGTCDADASEDLKCMMAAELSAVRDALSDNTTQQFRTLQNKLSRYQGDDVWH